MSDLTESSNDDTSALAFFHQASDAFDREDFEEAEELSRKAAKLFEQSGSDEVAKVYDQLGGIAYWRGDLDATEKWY